MCPIGSSKRTLLNQLTQFSGRVLTPREVTNYHHVVFRKLGLPNNAFEGTPFTGHPFEDKLTKHIWYRED